MFWVLKGSVFGTQWPLESNAGIHSVHGEDDAMRAPVASSGAPRLGPKLGPRARVRLVLVRLG